MAFGMSFTPPIGPTVATPRLTLATTQPSMVPRAPVPKFMTANAPGEAPPATTYVPPAAPPVVSVIQVGPTNQTADASGDTTLVAPPLRKKTPWLALGAGVLTIGVVGGAAIFLTSRRGRRKR